MSGRDLPAVALDAPSIFERASSRAFALELPYAGAVTPIEAYRLQLDEAAIVVDVRTLPEWQFVGRVPRSVLVEWRRYGERQPNALFVEELARLFDREQPLLFLCRSAVRSHHAAIVATRAGFSRAYNVLEGFEGELDPARRRGASGWRAAGLPWEQD
ncbi:MAG: rhodanese-like domain-containing protein [Bacillota bacterium]